MILCSKTPKFSNAKSTTETNTQEDYTSDTKQQDSPVNNKLSEISTTQKSHIQLTFAPQTVKQKEQSEIKIKQKRTTFPI